MTYEDARYTFEKVIELDKDCFWGYKGDFPVVGENSLLNRKLTSVLTKE